jgi:hypothetical protein
MSIALPARFGILEVLQSRRVVAAVTSSMPLSYRAAQRGSVSVEADSGRERHFARLADEAGPLGGWEWLSKRGVSKPACAVPARLVRDRELCLDT